MKIFKRKNDIKKGDDSVHFSTLSKNNEPE